MPTKYATGGRNLLSANILALFIEPIYGIIFGQTRHREKL